ncbi:MAG TPA: acyl-ACP--UDP-N-acetylglucosamine O-acyltransferase [Bdellovibrionota bacterium]|nr:acyl-ACP--UDP-N-acetylglucosamine O-acyltransferase [Bdellovibrionota bacterium]
MIHSTAIIHAKAKIGKNVKVGPYCIIGADVSIDEGTELLSHIVIEGPTRIGKNNRIFSFACLGQEPQDLKYQGEKSELIIGDNNTIRESTNIHRGTRGGGNKTVLGNNNLIMSLVHIGHDSILGNHVIIASFSGIAGHVTIEDKVFIAGKVGVGQFVRVGTSCYVGGFSRIDKDVPPFSFCCGTDHVEVRGVNIVGLKRQGYSTERINILRKVFHDLFDVETPLQENIKKLPPECKNDTAVSYLLDFIQSSEKGVITNINNA